MIRQVEPEHHLSLDDYEEVAHLAAAVHDLRLEARGLVPALEGRRVWMLNSAPRGGGVAELLPPLVTLLSELGAETRWLAMEPGDRDFFRLTKRIHNLIHGEGDPGLGEAERSLYRDVSRRTADALAEIVSAGDVLVVHDPQPMGAGAMLRNETEVAALWRCHIGLDRDTPETDAAWAFLEEYAGPYDHAAFTAPEYIPGCFAGRSTIIHPAIDPFSHKNRELPIQKLVGILANGSLLRPSGPVLTPAFPERAERLQPDGSWAPATEPEDLGLLFRPIVTQVSRWDRLKGFQPLMEGFVALKRDPGRTDDLPERARRTLELVRLVLAGPDPASVQDDPEALEVIEEIREAYVALPGELQEAVAVVTLPMGSAKFNALMVNALQRCSDVIVQNSLREGFGLTVTEAMWKHKAVLGSCAVGLRQQIRPDMDGVLVRDPEDPAALASALGELLRDPKRREALGRSAGRRVHSDFLVFTQVRRWLELLSAAVSWRWS